MDTVIERLYWRTVGSNPELIRSFRAMRLVKANENAFWGLYQKFCIAGDIPSITRSTFKYRWQLADVYVEDFEEALVEFMSLFTGEREEIDDEDDTEKFDTL